MAPGVEAVGAVNVDTLMRASLAAMDGLTTRQDVLAHNLANVGTPGYRAQAVDFESSLAASIVDGGAGGDVVPTVRDAGNQANPVGNSVDVTQDVLGIQQTQVGFEGAVAAFNFRHHILADGLAR